MMNPQKLEKFKRGLPADFTTRVSSGELYIEQDEETGLCSIHPRKFGEIKLVPAPEKSKTGDWNLYVGRKAILVDGVLYGYAEMHPRGTHGVSYTFRQAGGDRIRERQPSTFKNGVDRQVDVEVPGDKIAQWRTPKDLRPVAVRLLERATRLVNDGLLVSQAAYEARLETQHEAARAVEARRKAAKTRGWRKRAAACLPGGALPDDVENEATISKIVAAMKWAQTQ